MSLPYLQLYVQDVLTNTDLLACSPGAQGAWLRVMCLLHKSNEYGVLRRPLADIAKAVTMPKRYLVELVDRGLLKGGEEWDEDYEFQTKHAGKLGPVVILLKSYKKPCYFCARFLKDNYRRNQRGKSTRFTSDNQPDLPFYPRAESFSENETESPTARVGDSPNTPPIGREGVRQGDGLSLSLSEYSSTYTDSSVETDILKACAPDVKTEIEKAAIALNEAGVQDATATRPELIKALADGFTQQALVDIAREKVGKPLAYITKTAYGRKAEADGLQTVTAPPTTQPVTTKRDHLANPVSHKQAAISLFDSMLDQKIITHDQHREELEALEKKYGPDPIIITKENSCHKVHV